MMHISDKMRGLVVEREGIVNGTDSTSELHFPLYERAVAAGVLDGEGALIVAPTATGKSFIGQQAIRGALERGEDRCHCYLVPFRALADEVYETFLQMLDGTEARVRISTGDHRDPLQPSDADLVVATYESFANLVRQASFRPGVVVADEVHLIADETRGAGVEGLFARLLASGRAESICALSAVVENGEELARWLRVPLIAGSADDRPVELELESRLVPDVASALLDELGERLADEQALVFCSSRSGAERAAREVAELSADRLAAGDAAALRELADELADEGPEADDLASLLPRGVAYHHAGLAKPLRRRIEEQFRARRLRAITCTPTLAAGVNLPAGTVVVRDVFRNEQVRGAWRRVLLPSGEVLNMLGRAARPHHVSSGRGVALIEESAQDHPEMPVLLGAIEARRGGRVESRLTDSFEAIMRFVLAVVVEGGETSRSTISTAFDCSLAQQQNSEEVRFDRPFEEDVMEDLPAYERALKGGVALESYELVPEGVRAKVSGSTGRLYEVTIGVTGSECSCPAAQQWYRNEICKHQACAIHDLLFGEGVSPEVRFRTIYICGHVLGATLDAGTRLEQALQILTAWQLIERCPGGWRSTPMGEVALASGLDLLLIHEATDRIRTAEDVTHSDVARWAVQDYIAEQDRRGRWSVAVEEWLAEVDERKIKLPERYRGDFEAGLESLAQVCVLYAGTAEALGKPAIAAAARHAAGAVRYGVAPELVPLRALDFPQLRRARCRYLFERGVRDVGDLAAAEPAELADPRRAPEAYVRAWIEQARRIHDARAPAETDRDEAAAELDEIVSRFRIDPAALLA